jgi:hypothetical protein
MAANIYKLLHTLVRSKTMKLKYLKLDIKLLNDSHMYKNY